jgi:hypothetical protein
MPLRKSHFGFAAASAVLANLYLASFGAGTAHSAGGPIAVDAELVFAVDISRSMDRTEQELQRAGYVAALKSPEFLAALRANPLSKVAIAYIEWSAANDQEVLLNWTLIDGAESAGTAADKLAAAPYRRASRTSISGGIDFAVRQFDNNGFNSNHEVIDVSGDGPNNNGRPVTEARADAIAKGFVINGLPLVGIRPYIGFADIENLDVYYEDCVIGGEGAFMVTVHDTKDFVAATRTKLVREIAMVPPTTRRPLVQLAQAEEPRISCTIGESRSGRGYYYDPLPSDR